MMPPARPEITGRAAFSVNEFCARWGISRATFYEEVKAGRIDARKVRDKTIITVEADDDYRTTSSH
jgi:predicted site-specific integrase-resolvase